MTDSKFAIGSFATIILTACGASSSDTPIEPTSADSTSSSIAKEISDKGYQNAHAIVMDKMKSCDEGNGMSCRELGDYYKEEGLKVHGKYPVNRVKMLYESGCDRGDTASCELSAAMDTAE